MKIQSTLILLTGLILTTSLLGQGLERKPSPEDAKVYFIWPKDGREVNKNFMVKFGLSGMGIAPAGIDFPNSGHHHLLINVDEMPDFNMPLPATENIVHFGLGQTETKISLPSGKHTLQLVFADFLHLPHQPAVVSEKITITVK